MRLHRFYVKQPLGEELVVENVGEGKQLLHQWTSVFRYTRGNEVILFSPYDNQDYTYSIQTISKKEAVLSFLTKEESKKLSKYCTLYMALVKKDTFETIVRQATELGISTIIPVLADKSEKKNLNFERLTAIAIEASEQSGRGTVPLLGEIVTFSEALIKASSQPNIIGNINGQPLMNFNNEECNTKPSINIWIGPEGGWSKEEELLAKENNFFSIKLTETTLKADTAAIALLSIVLIA